MGKEAWRKIGFCFTFLPSDSKAVLHCLEKGWSLQDSMEHASVCLRHLPLARGWARRSNRRAQEGAAREGGGESGGCGIPEAGEMDGG